MARRELGIAFGGGMLTVALLWQLAACSIGQSGEAPVSENGGDAGDATVDTSTADQFVRDASTGDGNLQSDARATNDAHEAGPPCAGVICNGKCVAEADCSSCPGSPLLCKAQRTCLSTCAQCADDQNSEFPIECFACDSNHVNPIGTCGSADPSAYCLSGDYFAAGGTKVYHCACDGDAGSCPGTSQVCVPIGTASLCVTCGEPVPNGSAGVACKGGGACSPDTHTCAPSIDP
jgi:hypothetical protein